MHQIAYTCCASCTLLCLVTITAGEEQGSLGNPPQQRSPTAAEPTGERPQRDQAARGDELPFAKDNLVAWCIVPFDAKGRGPRERAEMLNRLGITKLAYDWRDEHVPSFEEEIIQSRRHGVEFFALWGWHEDFAPLIERHGVRPQLWVTNPSPVAATQQERISAAARQLLPLIERADRLQCRLGLYNHGGWGGEPESLVAVCRYLRERHRADHVGIVYNFHHGHEHIDDFEEHFRLMQPYLLCVNLNGMADARTVRAGRDKILPIGAGNHEGPMLQVIRESGYTGPIGIIDHRSDVDAEQSLRENLVGLRSLLSEQ